MLLLRFLSVSSSSLSRCSVLRSGSSAVAVAAGVLPMVAAPLRVVAGMAVLLAVVAGTLPVVVSKIRPVVALEVDSMGNSPAADSGTVGFVGRWLWVVAP